jgi:hypothetical protein
MNLDSYYSVKPKKLDRLMLSNGVASSSYQTGKASLLALV